MANWLKKFDQTMLGMLFTDQHLSPTEVVRIAQKECAADLPATRKASENKVQRDCLSHTQLVGLR